MRWRRNLAVAMGNALHAGTDEPMRSALVDGREDCNDLVREHIDWALAQRPDATPDAAPAA